MFLASNLCTVYNTAYEDNYVESSHVTFREVRSNFFGEWYIVYSGNHL
jgi:hypothetical protein